jgi:hypothetical protein
MPTAATVAKQRYMTIQSLVLASGKKSIACIDMYNSDVPTAAPVLFFPRL